MPANDRSIRNATERKYYAKNKRAILARQKIWYKENKAAVLSRERFRKYGITEEQYQQMVLAQKGACAICKVVPKRQLDVDHCHTSGRVRKLLCSACNTGLGKFKDNPALLQNAASYLISHRN